MQRVVPGGDTADNTHRRVLDFGIAGLFGEREVRQQFQVALGHRRRHTRLDWRGQFDRHAHFPANRLGDLRTPFFQTRV